MSIATRLATLPLPARRAITITLLVLVLLLAWWLMITPVAALVSSQQAWRQRTTMDIGEDRGIVKQAQALRTAREALNASPWPARLFVSRDGAGPDLQLQDEVRAALTQSGVEPTNFKVLPAG